jgi:signal transduction histidine kinase
MASATSSRPAASKPRSAAGISEARALDAPLRALARARRVAPLLYFELTGLDGLEARESRRIGALCAEAAAAALRSAVGSLLRRNDVVAAGPADRWFVALLLDRAVPARERAAVSDADLGIVAGRLRSAIRSALDTLLAAENIAVRAGVRAGWTIIEPRDGDRPLAELRQAVRGAAVVARVEERRATVFAAITHELRTPLTSILGYAEQLSGNEWENKQKRTRALRIVADESRRLARLVEGLIDAGAWQAGHLRLHKRTVKLRRIVDRAVAATEQRAASRNVCVRMRGDARASVDPERLLQVLVNLLDNAARHAHAGGSVHVAITALRGRPSITVSDDGSGFSTDPNQLGTPFGVGRNGRTGLGLAISKMLVEAHGGVIEFGSSQRGGARITVRLPATT